MMEGDYNEVYLNYAVSFVSFSSLPAAILCSALSAPDGGVYALGWALSYSTFTCSWARWVYTWVVEMLAWPRSS